MIYSFNLKFLLKWVGEEGIRQQKILMFEIGLKKPFFAINVTIYFSNKKIYRKIKYFLI